MSYNPFSLQGKTVFITGASSGIGRATAIECSRLGASVVITGRNVERLNETFAQLDVSEGQQHLQLCADLTSDEELKNLVNQVPQIDGLVCNAGIVDLKPIPFVSPKKIEELSRINLLAPTQLVRHLLKQRKINSCGSIVFTSSVGGVFRVSYGNSIYAMTKCGIDAYMRSAALELAPKNIRCNSVNPGMVDTEIMNRGQVTSEQHEFNKQNYPLKRYGKPEEIAWAIIYLLSDASTWMTGTALKIDGGLTLN